MNERDDDDDDGRIRYAAIRSDLMRPPLLINNNADVFPNHSLF